MLAQIERKGEVDPGGRHRRDEHRSGRVAEGAEAGKAAPFGFVGVDRHGGPIAATGARDVVDAAAERAARCV